MGLSELVIISIEPSLIRSSTHFAPLDVKPVVVDLPQRPRGTWACPRRRRAVLSCSPFDSPTSLEKAPNFLATLHHLPAQKRGVLEGHLQNGLDVAGIQLYNQLSDLFGQEGPRQRQLNSIGDRSAGPLLLPKRAESMEVMTRPRVSLVLWPKQALMMAPSPPLSTTM